MTPATVPDLIPVLPELFIALMAMALLMVGVFHKPTKVSQKRAAMGVSLLAVIALALTALIVLSIPSGRQLALNGLFVTDPFSVFTKVMVLIASGVAVVLSQDYMARQNLARFEFPVLILLATLGMMMMLSANNLLSMYLGIELQSLSLYIIAAFQRDDTRSSEAGLKYFVLGALASGMLLYGSSLVYGFSGTTDFDELVRVFTAIEGLPSVGVIIGIVFVIAGLAFKVSAVPFHMWTPDVYEGAPTPVTAFFSVAPKIAALALFCRVMLGPFGDLVSHWQQIIVFISIASMALGAFVAINQTNIKRMMAYSSISHVGYALIGLAVGNVIGLQGVLIYLAIYLAMNLGTFACILCMRRNGHMVEKISDLSGMSKSHPMVAIVLTLFMFSMAGVPPLAGFFGKFYIFLAAIDAGLYVLAVIGVLTSVVGTFYYLRIVKVMYFDDLEEPLDNPIPRGIGVVLAGTGLFILLFFSYPVPLLSGAARAAASLFGG